jgi:cytochrome c556
MGQKPLQYAVAALAILGATAVAAQDVYKERETLMKGFGQQMGVIKGAVVDK